MPPDSKMFPVWEAEVCPSSSTSRALTVLRFTIISIIMACQHGEDIAGCNKSGHIALLYGIDHMPLAITQHERQRGGADTMDWGVCGQGTQLTCRIS